jgi:hypothetical protein
MGDSVSAFLPVEDKKAILTQVFQLKPGLPVPLLVQPFGKWYATQDVMEDWAFDLARQTRRNEEHAQVADFSVPHLKTGIGLGAIAASFVGGCEWNEGSDAWITPLIGSDAQRVYDLTLPDACTSGMNGFIHERMRYFQEHGAYPLQPCNIASPLTTASYIWGYSDFLTALVEERAAVHHLLELVTRATIDFVRAQMAVIRELWCLSHEDWYMPTEMGIRVSDDVLAVISPRAYREFGVRYNNLLAREFGGIVIHSCGNIAFQIPTILENEGLRAIDLTLPHNDARAVRDAAAGRVALTMRYWLQDWEDRKMPDLEAYTDEAVALFGTRGVLLQMQTPALQDAIDLAARFRQKPWAAG